MIVGLMSIGSTDIVPEHNFFFLYREVATVIQECKICIEILNF